MKISKIKVKTCSIEKSEIVKYQANVQICSYKQVFTHMYNNKLGQ